MTTTNAETPRRPAIEDIAAKTCTGDVRDFLMQWGKNLQKPWPQMSQREQELFRDACGRQAETLVRKVTTVVGAQDHIALEITTRDFNRKGDRLEAKITTPYSLNNLDALARASDAGPIVLAVVSLEDFRGERAPAKIMPDQPDLMDEADTDRVDPETGEVLFRSGEDGEDASVESQEAGDDAALAEQQGAMADATSTLGPEAQENSERLAGGIRHFNEPGEPLGSSAEAAAPKKRGGRRTMEERIAANQRATENDAGQHQSS